MPSKLMQLHPAQQDVYMDQLINSDSSFYNLGLYVRIMGSLDKEKFTITAKSIANVFDAFKLRFDLRDALPAAYIDESQHEFELVEKDFPDTPDKVVNVTAWMKQQLSVPFTIGKDKQISEQYLIRITDLEHWYFIKIHHLVIDGYGVSALCQYIADKYRSLVTGEAIDFKFPSYIEEAARAAAYYRSDAYAAEGDYWKNKLSQHTQKLLQRKHQRAGDRKREAGAVTFEFEAGELERLNRLQLVTNANLQQLSMAALMTCFGNTTGQKNFVFGTPLHRRRTKALKTIVGLFTGVLPFTADYDQDMTLNNLIRSIVTTQREDYRNQNYLLGDLSRHFKVNGAEDSLVEIVVNNATIDLHLDLGEGLTTESTHIAPAEQPFPVELFWLDFGRQQRLKLRVDFQYRYFTEEEISLLVRRMLYVLQQFEDHLSTRVKYISVIPALELQQLLSFNNDSTGYPKDKTIVTLFEDQVQHTPDGIAVVYEQQQLTYRQLNDRANQLGHYLTSLGTKEEMLIPVCLERSVEMIIALLAVLKIGSAYVPIDPSYPQDRIRYILDDTEATTVICNSSHADIFKASQHVEHLILTDQQADTLNKQPLTPVPANIQPHYIAYVIYTSGSTGKPKGVLIEHRNVVRLFKTETSLFDFTANDVWTLFHSYSFDFSVWEMYGALLFGGKAVVVPKKISQDPYLFKELIKREGVTVLSQTPGAFYNLIEADKTHADAGATIRYVIFGGEALSPGRLKEWKERYTGCRLINMYGITETTVHVTYKEIGDAEIESGISNIGKAIPTLNCYILDADQHVVPIGVAGELHIGGAGLARGYLKRPELTAEKFIENPHKPGDRLYKTGDLGRWLPDGNIEYLGRKDDQVKIRGHRIELGEIEKVLQDHKEVESTVVIAGTIAESSQKELIAYFVGTAKPSGLRLYLEGKLPDYMIPSYLINIEKIPLTGNGKIDHKALPAPGSLQLSAEVEYIAPANDIEQTIADIWIEVLGHRHIGVRDNFFHIGGDSIKAIRVSSKINAALGRNIAIADLYTNQNIENLARSLSKDENKQRQADYISSVLSIQELKDKTLAGLPDISIVEDVYPMSDIQKGMVFHALRDIEQGVFHDQMVHQIIEPDFQPERFKRAYELMMEKHSIFRTGFHLSGYEEPIQIVYKDAAVNFEHHDISHLTKTEQEEHLMLLLEMDRKDPFDLAIPSLSRIRTFSLGGDKYCYMFICHHAIIDGWSDASFNVELFNIYRELKTAPDFTPLQLKNTYKHFVIEQLVEKKNIDAIAYWKSELDGFKRLLFLPLDKEERSDGIGRYQQDKGEDFLKQLKTTALNLGVNIQHLCFAAYAYMLNMLTYEHDFVTGLVSNNRPVCEDGDSILGCFLNTVPVRLQIPADITWKEYADYIDKKLIEVRNHNKLPLFDIAQHIGEKTGGQNPLFDCMFNYVDFHVYQSDIDKRLKLIEEDPLAISGRVIPNTLLNVHVNATLEKFVLIIDYSQAIINRETAEKLGHYFIKVLQQIIAVPAEKVSKIGVLLPEEQQRLLDFNNTEVAYPKDKTIVDVFEAQVVKNPGSIAVVFNEQVLTYEELNEKANQLAYYLRSIGVKQQSLVAICVERSLPMIIGLLGILKAGGAYIAIPPQFPPDRIKYLVDDAQADVIVTSDKCRSLVQESRWTHLVNIDKDSEQIKKEPVTNPISATAPDQLIYMVYTSGSTGKPKAVMTEHGSLMNFLYAMVDKLEVTGTSAFLALASYSFDGSCMEIYLPFLTGGKVIVTSQESVTDGYLLQQVINKYRPSYLQATPTALELLLDSGWRNQEELIILSGGEAIKENLVYTLKALSGQKVWNLYGPTEATLYATMKELQPPEKISVGKPIHNYSIHIVNEYHDLQPLGVVGEICIGGAGVARGYLNRPELTAQTFIENPYRPGERLYKTGDLGRWLPDGNIECLGRKDDQVKIRGYRIELGEIENVLQRCDQVKQSVVLAKEDTGGNRRLVAYIVPEGTFDKEYIQSYLRSQLPDYMVPSLMVELDKMPLNSNGKVDKKALPDPDASALISREYVPPRNEVEEKLALIWKEVLQIDRVGIHDNFFELGGHSLLVTRVVSAVRKQLSVEVKIKDLFTKPTIAVLAEYIATEGQAATSLSITAQERPDRIPLSFSQERLWFIDKLEGSVHYHIPAIFRLQGNVDKEALAYAFREIVNRHEALRTVIVEEDGEGYQQVQDRDTWELTYTTEAVGESLEELIAEETSCPFDLSKDIMLRAHLVKLSNEEHVLIIVIHHIAADGWSFPILVNELRELYKAYLDQGPTLVELPIQYADYTLWQRSHLTEDVLENKLEYWQQKLTGIEPLNLPTDYIRPAIQSNNGSSLSFQVNKEISDGLQALSDKEGTTLFMTLLSAFKVLLYRYTGQSDVCVGTPIANRTQKEVEPLIGFFVNTLALRSQLAADKSFKDLLSQVKLTTLEAYQYQEVPFGKVVDKVSGNRDRSRSPLFQVMLVLQNNAEIPALELGTVRLSQQPFSYPVTKFDITLNITQRKEGIDIIIEYNTDLFARQTITRLKEHYERMLSAVVANPLQAISKLTMLGQAEEEQLLHEFNNKTCSYPLDKTIVDLFEEQVARVPNNISVVFEDKKLSYTALNKLSNQLGDYLRNNYGIKPDDLIGIRLDRSEWVIVAILGILKSGGAYVPIDPSYPQERIDYIVEDSACKVVIDQQVLEKFIVNKDTYNSADQKTATQPRNLVYCIYTSGSTGKPKGVLIEHRNLIHSTVARLALYPNIESFLLLSSIAFDSAVAGIFSTLCAGGELCITRQIDVANIKVLAEYIVAKEISHLLTIPSYYQELLSVLKGKHNSLKQVIVAGESCATSLVDYHYSLDTLQHCDLFNEYGPTEGTVWSSVYQYTGTKAAILSIGKPISNTQIYILDDQQSLVAIGVIGELCIGGAGLARGYLNRPELTAERFITHPYKPGERLYKTGDLARWLPDGNIEYLGRKDDQVKIRGYRIELGEIENVLQKCDQVKQCVVLAKADTGGNRRLVAYIVAEDTFDKLYIQSYLRNQLPDYMIPSLMMALDKMPLNANGKVDKKALPDPDTSALISRDYVAPENEVEEKLASIWKEILQVERVGVHDNFFELGGHSLSAIRVVSAIKKEFSLDIPIHTLFEFTCIADLSEYLEVLHLVGMENSNNDQGQVIEL